MNSTSGGVKACCASEYALAKLSSLGPGRIGKVRSVHSGLFNIILDDGDLLAVQLYDRVKTPLSIVLARQWKGRVNVGEAETVFLDCLQKILKCGLLEVSFADAAGFSSNAVLVFRGAVDEPLEILTKHLNGNAGVRSVYQFIRPDGETRFEDEIERQYGDFLSRHSLELIQGFRRGDIGGILNAEQKIIGLGPGMTPAGDDYLQGFFLFLQTSQREKELIRKVGESIDAESEPNTTELSRTLWRHFWQGRVAEPVVRMVNSFNEGDWNEFERQVKILSALGHSSGDDYLSGVWQALHFICGNASSGREEN